MRSSHCGGWKSSVSLSFLRITLLLQPLTQQFGIYIFLNILKRSLILIINKHGPSFSSKFYQFILVSLNWDERNKNLICYYKRHKLNESITQTNCLARLTKIVFSKYRGREESDWPSWRHLLLESTDMMFFLCILEFYVYPTSKEWKRLAKRSVTDSKQVLLTA